MAFVFVKQPAALMLGAGALALAVGTASAAPLVKECGKNGKFRHRLLAGQQRRALPPARQ